MLLGAAAKLLEEHGRKSMDEETITWWAKKSEKEAVDLEDKASEMLLTLTTMKPSAFGQLLGLITAMREEQRWEYTTTTLKKSSEPKQEIQTEQQNQEGFRVSLPSANGVPISRVMSTTGTMSPTPTRVDPPTTARRSNVDLIMGQVTA